MPRAPGRAPALLAREQLPQSCNGHADDDDRDLDAEIDCVDVPKGWTPIHSDLPDLTICLGHLASGTSAHDIPVNVALEALLCANGESLAGVRPHSRAMTVDPSRVTVHMVASLDGFIARKDGRVDWMETSDAFAGGDAMDPAAVEAFLATIDCYVMGSRTYETALAFEAKGFGWAYGDKPTFVLTSRALPRLRETVEFRSGDLAEFVNDRLRPVFRSIWVVGGGMVSSDCVRFGLADEIRYAILPVLIGDGIPFFDRIDADIPLHLMEVKAYDSGLVELRYEVS